MDSKLKKLKTLIFLGFVVIVAPFLGLPFSTRKWILFVAGVFIVVVAFLLKRKEEIQNGKENNVFVENGNGDES